MRRGRRTLLVLGVRVRRLTAGTPRRRAAARPNGTDLARAPPAAPARPGEDLPRVGAEHECSRSGSRVAACRHRGATPEALLTPAGCPRRCPRRGAGPVRSHRDGQGSRMLCQASRAGVDLLGPPGPGLAVCAPAARRPKAGGAAERACRPEAGPWRRIESRHGFGVGGAECSSLARTGLGCRATSTREELVHDLDRWQVDGRLPAPRSLMPSRSSKSRIGR
jgi:hypothetical protein